ncbi:MBL fold metallo-hydrolase [Acidianus brierleyi]|uniref:MBL fold metallo-hydrolase n=1 Tax=Acidianus brierleyi TaxID=41673 RepID=A0A2U9II09_9CREN|nr:MBL fold metallo-hydrolase [Acidianus brierleyi]AWR95669.1 MBL fold metallo-hydrolase [Acidianus brierleyi]
MIIERFVSGPLSTNTYVLIYGNESLIIDSEGDMTEVINFLKSRNIIPNLFIATHGHFDHILGINRLKYEFPSLRFLINKKDLELVANAESLAKYFGIRISPIILPDCYVKEGDKIKIGEEELVIIETPGHTMGSICILTNNAIFTGDTLFSGTVGRTDLGGSLELLKNSLERLKTLPDELTVYPGHGNSTQLGYEKINNLFLTGEVDL